MGYTGWASSRGGGIPKTPAAAQGLFGGHDMDKPTNHDPVEWAIFNDWLARCGAREAFIQALKDSEAMDALNEECLGAPVALIIEVRSS